MDCAAVNAGRERLRMVLSSDHLLPEIAARRKRRESKEAAAKEPPLSETGELYVKTVLEVTLCARFRFG